MFLIICLLGLDVRGELLDNEDLKNSSSSRDEVDEGRGKQESPNYRGTTSKAPKKIEIIKKKPKKIGDKKIIFRDTAGKNSLRITATERKKGGKDGSASGIQQEEKINPNGTFKLELIVYLQTNVPVKAKNNKNIYLHLLLYEMDYNAYWDESSRILGSKIKDNKDVSDYLKNNTKKIPGLPVHKIPGIKLLKSIKSKKISKLPIRENIILKNSEISEDKVYFVSAVVTENSSISNNYTGIIATNPGTGDFEIKNGNLVNNTRMPEFDSFFELRQTNDPKHKVTRKIKVYLPYTSSDVFTSKFTKTITVKLHEPVNFLSKFKIYEDSDVVEGPFHIKVALLEDVYPDCEGHDCMPHVKVLKESVLLNAPRFPLVFQVKDVECEYLNEFKGPDFLHVEITRKDAEEVKKIRKPGNIWPDMIGDDEDTLSIRHQIKWDKKLCVGDDDIQVELNE